MSGNTSATGGFVQEVPPRFSGESVVIALQQATVAITGLPGNLVRPRWQHMPPTQPDAGVSWVAVGVNHVEADDYPFIAHDGYTQLVGAAGPGVDRMQRHCTISAMITFYGPEAEDMAGMFRDALYIQQNWEPMFALGLKLREVHDLARNAELVNQQWIDRLDIKLEMRGQLNRVYPILNLDGADVVLHVQDGATHDTPVTVRPDTAVNP